MSAGGIDCWRNSNLNDGIAMAKRMRTGSTVHATSIIVLWVVRVGFGLAWRLNFTATTAISTSTNNVMAVMMKTRPVWNQTMSSITGEAESCNPICHGEG